MSIPVYDNEEIVATVSYNDNLDYWDGNNRTNGGVGLHKGLTRLKKSGKYVLIHGTQWQGSRDYAEVVSKKQAVREIIASGNNELFERYPELNDVYMNEFDSD